MGTIRKWWKDLEKKNPTLTQFIMFTIVSQGVTLLQLIMMPVFKAIFNQTNLVDIAFQIGHIGTNFDGSPYYMFSYAAGTLESGGGGGLAYFLAVELTLAIAQVINFFLQRNVAFKSNSSQAKAAVWYVIAYILITIGAAALQGLYKAPIYNQMINVWGMGKTGETLADIATMLINSIISYWVFFPIFKVIFRQEPETEKVPVVPQN